MRCPSSQRRLPALGAFLVNCLLSFMISACTQEKTSNKNTIDVTVKEDSTHTQTARASLNLTARDTTQRVPFSEFPTTPEWRLGFTASDGVELIEILPTSPELYDERDRLVSELYSPEKSSGVVLLSYGRASTLKKTAVLNPPQWTILDLHGNLRKETFTKLTAIAAEYNSGCYYLAPESFRPEDQEIVPIAEITDANLIFAIAGEPRKRPLMRLPLFDIPRDKDGTFTENAAFLPRNYRALLDLPEIKALFDDSARQSIEIFGNAIVATIAQSPDTLWAINFFGPGDGSNSNLFGIFREMAAGGEPLFLEGNSPLKSDFDYMYFAGFTAAADLDGDNHDELVVRALYSEGSAYAVFSLQEGRLVRTYSSFYHGL